MVNCKRCGKELRSVESIKRGFGATCYRIVQLQKAEQPEQPEPINNSILEELLNRVKRLELDNNFMKHQLKHKTIVSKSKDSELNLDLKPEVKKAMEETKIEFNFVVKELKVIFHENFNYHDVLSPIQGRIEPEVFPLIPIVISA